MKKYLLLLSCSILACYQAEALSRSKQLDAMKELFVKEFESMDENEDGKISKEEFLAYQFENFRATILQADGFDDIPDIKVSVKENAGKKADVSLPKKQKEKVSKDEQTLTIDGMVSSLEDMANYTLDEEDLNLDEEDVTDTKSAKDILSPEDVLPDMDLLAKISKKDKTPEESEEIVDELQTEVLANVDIKKIEQADTADADEKMNTMLEVIKTTLPKKIDDITTWTDIRYNNKEISYIYQADVDVSSFSKEEMSMLQTGIKDEACKMAYEQMCSKIKPMIIDKGYDMKILYEDKNNRPISSCDFNKNTCK